MTDQIYRSFLEREGQDLSALCEQSDALQFQTMLSDESLPPNIFVISLRCQHALWEIGEVVLTKGICQFGIQLPRDYLRRQYPDSGQILSLITPVNLFHPNVRWPFICSGPVAPGTPAVELIMRVHEILTFYRFTPREDDCLNPAACQWARDRMDDFPLECEPLRRVEASRSSQL